MQLNRKFYDEQTWSDMVAAADVHLQFVFELYEWQQVEGRLWLHEHPEGAFSWKKSFV